MNYTFYALSLTLVLVAKTLIVRQRVLQWKRTLNAQGKEGREGGMSLDIQMMVFHSGICQTEGNATRPTCVPLCRSMGLMMCACESAEDECLVCCRDGNDCVTMATPLADGSFCQDGVCINVSG